MGEARPAYKGESPAGPVVGEETFDAAPPPAVLGGAQQGEQGEAEEIHDHARTHPYTAPTSSSRK
jgi:hypothetical protein